MRVVVTDDEPLARRRLRALLARHADVQVIAECANGLEAVDAVRAHRPDALFVDVQMPGMTGLDVVRALGDGTPPAVVFVTAYDAHAVQAFEQHALDYVLKPVDEARFDRTVARVRTRLQERRECSAARGLLELLAERQASPVPVPPPGIAGVAGVASPKPRYPARLLLRGADKLAFVDVATVDWVEADDDYVRLHAGKASHLMRSTLGALEAQLDPAEFARIHRSTIVRVSRIRELQPYFHGEYVVVLQDGTKLKLSRSYRDRLQAIVGQSL